MGLSLESTTLDIPAIRRDFPILERETAPGVQLVYLDNAATSQKPVQVIESMDFYYRQMNANIHRGIHCLAEEATVACILHRRGELAGDCLYTQYDGIAQLVGVQLG